jgi:pilus assembly protein CpaD
MSNYGCSVNSAIAAMVADPEDLVHGREAAPVTDARTASRAVLEYRTKAPTGEGGLQAASPKGGN